MCTVYYIFKAVLIFVQNGSLAKSFSKFSTCFKHHFLHRFIRVKWLY